ncbi:MAG: small multi-drug export protein [Clostridia bacterium]|nr:small multi-drug export protein [Clostridia bacterium]
MNYFYVALISMVPILELRAAIPLGLGMGLNVYLTYLIAVTANLLPIPFVLFLSRPLMNFLKSTKVLKPIADKLERKVQKNRTKIMKYSAFGLFLFVAVPLPGTGAWSGALAASLFDMRFKYSFPSIVFGVMTAGVIMCFGTSIVQWLINLF